MNCNFLSSITILYLVQLHLLLAAAISLCKIRVPSGHGEKGWEVRGEMLGKARRDDTESESNWNQMVEKKNNKIKSTLQMDSLNWFFLWKHSQRKGKTDQDGSNQTSHHKWSLSNFLAQLQRCAEIIALNLTALLTKVSVCVENLSLFSFDSTWSKYPVCVVEGCVALRIIWNWTLPSCIYWKWRFIYSCGQRLCVRTWSVCKLLACWIAS